MPTVMDVANYFLSVQTPENDITNLKLQKLCAYAQALSLAYLGRPLFSEPLEAWTHGPVAPCLYHEYERFGSDPLPSPGLSAHYAREPFDDDQKFVLDLVRDYYGKYAAWELRERSHRDFPGDFGSRNVISDDAIKRAFAQDALVQKLKSPPPVPPQDDRLVSEKEVRHALGF